MSCVWLFLMLGVLGVVQSVPVTMDGEESESVGEGGTSVAKNGPWATLAFLRKFGYLEPLLENNASETLYSEEKMTQAIKQMQHFGALAETGKLNEETLALLTKRRCGVPDIVTHLSEEYSSSNRKKRFVLGSNGWNKRKLSYRLENWSPKLFPDKVHEDLSKAMKIWSEYANLNFINKTDPHHDQVDIAISFGKGHHGDRFPFDGEGGTLAHAFFPQNFAGISGDIHFDMDEPWYHHRPNEPPTNGGVSFMDVALHELGHSLGLAHSPSMDSVMFPYYKSLNGDPKLGQDDIMALYHLYISRNLDDEDEPTRKSTTTPKIRTTTTTPKTVTTRRYTRKPTTTSSISTTLKSTTQSTTTKTKSDLCEDGFDTIAFIRNELFVFRDEFMWRWIEKGQLSEGSYPAHASRLFPLLQGIKKVDAAFERESDGSIVFISGKNYWTFDGVNSEGPRPLTDFGLPDDLENIDAAFLWGKNKKTYFFKGNKYWKYNNETLESDNNYPASITARWRGVPSNINSVFTYKDGKTYFFRGQEFWRFDDIGIHTEDDFPMNTGRHWFNCEK